MDQVDTHEWRTTWRAAAKEYYERQAEQRAAAATAAAEAERLYQEAVTAWIAAYGSPSQQARHAEGLLPQEELERAISDQVFRSLDGLPRYSDHSLRCSDYCPSHCLQLEISPATGLSEAEYVNLTAIRERIRESGSDGFTITLRLHSVGCSAAGFTKRVVAYVGTDWHGRILIRQYAL